MPDCARDAIDASGLRVLARESLSLARAGLRVRFRVAVRDIWRAPWRQALAALPLPLAATLLCVWTFGFVPATTTGLWALLLGGSFAALVGAAFESRRLTALGAGAVFVAAASP